MKRLLFLVTCILVANTVSAEWNKWATVWPSESNQSFDVQSDRVTFSNEFVTAEVTQIFTVTATTNLPGYSADGYIYVNPDTNGFWKAAFDGYSLGVTPTVGVDSNMASSSALTFSTTNISWWEITHSTDTNELDDFFEPPFGVPANTTNVWYDIRGSSTNTITEVLAKSQNNIVIPEITLDKKDLRLLECFASLKEREDVSVLSVGDYQFVRLFDNDGTEWFFKSQGLYDYLIMWKRYIKIALSVAPPATGGNFIDLSLYSGGTLDAFLATTTDGSMTNAILSVTNFYENVAVIPTNWLDYTPRDQLNGAGISYGHLITNSWILVGGAGTITNYVRNYLGDNIQISGTNGELVSVIVTNANVLDGFSELDYGIKHWTNVIAQLQETTFVGDPAISQTIEGKHWYPTFSSSSNSFAEVQGWCTNFFLDSTPGFYSRGSYDPRTTLGLPPIWTAARYNHEWTFQALGLSTNLVKVVDFYLRATNTISPDTAIWAATNIFNDNGFAVTENETVYFGSSASTNGSTNICLNTLGSTNQLAVWCPDPNLDGSTNSISEGFTLHAYPAGGGQAYLPFLWVVKWDFDYQ